MKQKTIIQIWGHENTGKSTTIRILKEKLSGKLLEKEKLSGKLLEKEKLLEEEKIYNCSIINEEKTHHGDFSCTMKLSMLPKYPEKSYKIGIESLGDHLWAYGLKNRLDKFIINERCDILICAGRIRNNVLKHIEYLADTHGYRLLKCTNYTGKEPPFSQNDINQLSAKHLMDLFNEILTGKV